MRFEKTHIISLVNQKGGVGKTTTAVNLAGDFAYSGYKTLFVDMDPQCNGTSIFADGLPDTAIKYTSADLFTPGAYEYFEPDSEGYTIQVSAGDRFFNRLDFISSLPDLADVENEEEVTLQLQARMMKNPAAAERVYSKRRDELLRRVKENMDAARGRYDVVIFDTPPNRGLLQVSSLVASDWFIIVMEPGRFALDGLEDLAESAAEIQRGLNPDLLLGGVLLNRTKHTNLSRDVHEAIKERYEEDIVFRNYVPERTKIGEATGYYRTIQEHDSGREEAEIYHQLRNEMVTKYAGLSNSSFPSRDVFMKKAVANG